MWDRKELKAKGKAAYRANRLMCIIAALLLAVVTGGGGFGASFGTSINRIGNSGYDDDYYFYFDEDDGGEYVELYDEDEEFDEDDGEIYLELDEDGFEYDDEDGDYEIIIEDSDNFISPWITVVIIFIVLIAVAVGLALGAFLFNPLLVGLRKFFVDNATIPAASLNKFNIGLAFGKDYIKVVGSMFTTGIFEFLWSLLLIIPGIYKSYCWRLVPYIVAENPGITGKEARDISNRMMDGSKWGAFVLDLSFLGWLILGALTLGILNLIFTNPYKAATDAELYLALSGRPSGYAEPAAHSEEDVPEVVFELDQEGIND